MDKPLTKKQLADRWQVTERTIENYVKEGILSTCKGIPTPRFALQYIMELEGVHLEKFSPIEKRKLERRIEQLEEENRQLKKCGSDMLIVSARIANVINQ